MILLHAAYHIKWTLMNDCKFASVHCVTLDLFVLKLLSCDLLLIWLNLSHIHQLKSFFPHSFSLETHPVLEFRLQILRPKKLNLSQT